MVWKPPKEDAPRCVLQRIAPLVSGGGDGRRQIASQAVNLHWRRRKRMRIWVRPMECNHLSDDQLESELALCCFNANQLTGRILAYLNAVELREIFLRRGYSSIYAYCKGKLGMSGGQAYRRIAGARLIRRYPFLLERIALGEIHLTTLAHIAPFITDENVHALVADTVGRTREQVDVLLSERFGIKRPSAHPLANVIPMDDELVRMVQRARELYSHAVPKGDALVLAKRAFALLIEKGERQKRGRSDRPRPAPTKPTKNIPREVVRQVYARHGEQCTYVDEQTGHRCTSRTFLETHHDDARALGGGHVADRIRPLCAPHHRLETEKTFGRDYVERRIQRRREERQKRRAPAAPSLAKVTAHATAVPPPRGSAPEGLS